MRIIALLFALFVFSSYVDGRHLFATQDPGKVAENGMTSVAIRSSKGISPDFFCRSCLEVSKNAVKALRDPLLPEKVSIFVNDACQILPSDMRVKCVEMLEMHINQAIVFLEDYFSEENLCNSTGLCPSNANAFSMLNSKVSDDKNCAACHAVMEDIRDDLEDPEMKLKVIKILLKACNNVENHVKECKKMILEYGPLIMANIGKYLDNNDFCTIVRICTPTSHDILTNAEDFHPLIRLPTSSSSDAISK